MCRAKTACRAERRYPSDIRLLIGGQRATRAVRLGYGGLAAALQRGQVMHPTQWTKSVGKTHFKAKEHSIQGKNACWSLEVDEFVDTLVELHGLFTAIRD